MAWSGSQVFAFAVLDVLGNNTKPTADSYKVALYNNASMTPDATVTTAVLTEYGGSGSQWITGNETTGTGYSAGGVSVTPVSVTQASNVVTVTSSGSPQWTGATFTAYGALVYDTTNANKGLSFNFFGGLQTVTAGTFTLTWNASGICAFSC